MAWVTAERVGERRYTGRNERGAIVAMGPVEQDGAFTPGELLGVALAGCAGMSADRAIVRRLGEDPAVVIEVDQTKHETEDRYAALAERFVLDLAALSPADRAELATVIGRAIDKACTVGNTLKASADVTQTLATSPTT